MKNSCSSFRRPCRISQKTQIILKPRVFLTLSYSPIGRGTLKSLPPSPREHVTLSERKIKSPKHLLPLRPIYGLLIFSGKGRHAPHPHAQRAWGWGEGQNYVFIGLKTRFSLKNSNTRNFLAMNPYRLLYSKQAKWHKTENIEHLEIKHKTRARYYSWYTKDWLPSSRQSRILDIGCGTGSFVFFLKGKGYENIAGADLDETQVKLAQGLGLPVQLASAQEYLQSQKPSSVDLIAMLDIIEHFTAEELFDVMNIAYEALAAGGKIIVSVPNATSLIGLSTRFSDITHETCFSPTTLSQLFFCHDMEIIEFRDPWPAPITLGHRIWYVIAKISRSIERLRFKLLGLSAPKYWSSVIWAVAQKPELD